MAGSLGKAFVRYLKDAHELIGYDNSEWAVAEFKQEFPDVDIRLGDFTNWNIKKDPVKGIIHTAAYKHVNLGEVNVDAFIDNNINKTRELFCEATMLGTSIVFISTDKAVEPISLYGYTKAIGEYITNQYGGTVVRCGNFISSSGSVIPTWEKAIAEGKPIPITHLDMKRFVIDVDDAAKQIWDGLLKGEKLIIPKCKEVGIMELLKEVLKKHKLTEEDVSVDFIGIRDGEKLQEKLMWDKETK